MTAGGLSTRSDPSHNQSARSYFDQASGQRSNTDVVVVEAIRSEYPNLHLTVVPEHACNLQAWAAAGHASLVPIDKEKDRLSWRLFVPPARRLDGARGALGDSIKFGKFLLEWNNREYVTIIAEGRDGNEPYPIVTNQYVLSSSVESINKLIFEAGAWNSELHSEIWVFDQGFWQKDAELWNAVQKSHWEDVILQDSMKKAIIADMDTFYGSRDTYDKLRVPWKRGLIFHGPPGNGKSISIKAIMRSLYQREKPVPTLYVRTLVSFAGPEYSIGQIFNLARRTAPCLLVFEDLDSLITDSVRSYFLNAVDGIAKNDGILMIGSTNYLERLDPGIAKRPSRFDRKYLFPNPNEEERTTYMFYWQKKLLNNDELDFPDKICPAVAKITDRFSFAYMQEAVVAALLAIARNENKAVDQTALEHMAPPEYGDCILVSTRSMRPLQASCEDSALSVASDKDEEDPDLENYVLWREIKKQVHTLQEDLDEEE